MMRCLWATNGVFTNKMNNRLALLCWKTMLWPCSSRATIFDATYLYLRDCFFPCTWVCGKNCFMWKIFSKPYCALRVFFFLPVQILGTKALRHTGRCQKASVLDNSADCVFLDWVTGLKCSEDSWNFISEIMFFSVQAFPPHHGSVASTIKHLAVLYRKQV